MSGKVAFRITSAGMNMYHINTDRRKEAVFHLRGRNILS